MYQHYISVEQQGLLGTPPSLLPEYKEQKTTVSKDFNNHAGCSTLWGKSEYEEINWGALLSNVHWLHYK